MCLSLDAILCNDAGTANTTRASVIKHSMKNGCRQKKMVELQNVLVQLHTKELTFLDKFEAFLLRHILPERLPNMPLNIRATRSTDGVRFTDQHSSQGNLVHLAAVFFIPSSHDDTRQQGVTIVVAIVTDLRSGLGYKWLLICYIPNWERLDPFKYCLFFVKLVGEPLVQWLDHLDTFQIRLEYIADNRCMLKCSMQISYTISANALFKLTHDNPVNMQQHQRWPGCPPRSHYDNSRFCPKVGSTCLPYDWQHNFRLMSVNLPQ